MQSHVKDKFDEDIDNMDALKEKSRKKHIVYFRRVMMVILGESFLKNYTEEDIASVVDLHRTSFIHHSKTHLNHYTTDSEYKAEYDALRDEFLEKIDYEKQ